MSESFGLEIVLVAFLTAGGGASRKKSGHNHCTSFSSEVFVAGLWGAMANTRGLGGAKCPHGGRRRLDCGLAISKA